MIFPPDTDYAMVPGHNWSSIKSLRVSAFQYKHDRENPRADTDFFRVGGAAHAFLLEPETFEQRFICFHGRRQGKAWETFQEEHADKRILNETEWTDAIGCATAIATHPVAAEYLHAGWKEQIITWQDKETGLQCKARVDHAGKWLVEVKSTSKILPRLFATHAAQLGYHGQIAYQWDGLRANDIYVEPEPIIISVQSSAPYDVVPYKLAGHTVDAGREEYRRLLKTLKRCLETDLWPGLAGDTLWLEMPEWVYGDVALTSGGEEIEL